jgi:signal transduction histidine kinase
MDAETQRQIFEPYFSTRFVGRGMGLAMVRGIVERHHGAFAVVSAPGQGTAVELLFLVNDGDSPNNHAPTTTP